MPACLLFIVLIVCMCVPHISSIHIYTLGWREKFIFVKENNYLIKIGWPFRKKGLRGFGPFICKNVLFADKLRFFAGYSFHRQSEWMSQYPFENQWSMISLSEYWRLKSQFHLATFFLFCFCEPKAWPNIWFWSIWKSFQIVEFCQKDFRSELMGIAPV